MASALEDNTGTLARRQRKITEQHVRVPKRQKTSSQTKIVNGSSHISVNANTEHVKIEVEDDEEIEEHPEFGWNILESFEEEAIEAEEGIMEENVDPLALENNSLHQNCVPMEVFEGVVQLLKKENSELKKETEKRFRNLEVTVLALQQKLCGLCGEHQINGNQADKVFTMFPQVLEILWNKYRNSMINLADFLATRLVYWLLESLE